MNLAVETRLVGDVGIVRCTGRIVEGGEADRLRGALDELIDEAPFIVLNLSSVDFIDSSGVGLLVRYLHKTESARGGIKLCGVPARIREALAVTHLAKLFEMYDAEEEAIAAFCRARPATALPYEYVPDILCVASSPDVLAYVRELVGQSGYGVVSASNVPDALTLLKATQPKVVVMTADVRNGPRTPTAEKFHQLAANIAVVELPADFSTHDAADAARHLLERIRTVVTTPHAARHADS